MSSVPCPWDVSLLYANVDVVTAEIDLLNAVHMQAEIGLLRTVPESLFQIQYRQDVGVANQQSVGLFLLHGRQRSSGQMTVAKEILEESFHAGDLFVGSLFTAHDILSYSIHVRGALHPPNPHWHSMRPSRLARSKPATLGPPS